MLFAGCTLLALVFAPAPQNGPAAAPPALDQILNRITREAVAFRRLAPVSLAEETLEQRSRPNAPGAFFESHELVSVYGFAGRPDAPNAVHEVRKVISVDGKRVTTVAKAREAMTLGLTGSDDKLKKRLLEDFEKHGLHGAATDFGQAILLFSPGRLADYDFQLAGERQLGATRILVIAYKQKGGNAGITVFLGNQAKREPLHGEISVRRSDLRPLRITLNSRQVVNDVPFKEESTVDYRHDPAGAVLPLSVVHREYANGELLGENRFTYSAFRRITPGSSPKLPEPE